MIGQRPRLAFNVGSWLELVGAVAFCAGVGLKAGLWLALVFAGILLVVAAELIYDHTVVRVPLPRRPSRPTLPHSVRRLWRRVTFARVLALQLWVRRACGRVLARARSHP